MYESIEDLDFHSLPPGTEPGAVIVRLDKALASARRERIRVVRVIVGKGINSTDGPVVKPAVENHLRNLTEKGIIRGFEYDTLPSGRANEGALVVRL